MSALQTQLDGEILIITLTNATLDHQDQVWAIGAELLRLAGEQPPRNILLDFRHVEFMSSVMVGQLFLLHSKCRAERINLKMCRVAKLIHKVLNIVRLDDFIEIVDDERAAREAFQWDRGDTNPWQNGQRAARIEQQAQQGDAEAQFELAQCCEFGRGVSHNPAAALRWYQQAAERGHADAQHRVGMAYAYGIQVDQDYEQAVKWFLAAAQQGHADAQYSLGMSYHYGIAVPEDRDEAVKWYRQAAEQGHEKAQEELAQLE